MKKILSALLTVAILASMLTLPAKAQDAETITNSTETCPCGCGKALSAVNWKPWNVNKDGDPASGHYYLEDNYAQLKQHTVISGDRVVLDLRGHTLTTGGTTADNSYHRLLQIYGYMAVLDSVGGGVFTGKTSGAAYGGLVTVSTNETNDPTFELYSGTIMPERDSKGSLRGGLIYLSENATFRMYGGRLMNGTTVNSSSTGYPGGCLAAYAATARIEVLGGEIIGGEATTHGGNIYSIGTTVLKNCRIIGGVAASAGGNICHNGGSLSIENCVIADGVSNHASSNGGGNICLMSGTKLTVKDSTLRNGYAANYGGNLYIGSGSAVLENTEVYSGVAGKRGSNIYGSTSATAMTIRNCQLPGDVAYIGANLTLEGLVKIGLLNNGLKLWYGSSRSVISAADLSKDSEIYVDANGIFAGAGVNLSYFKGALRTVLSDTAEGLMGTQAASGEHSGYCPHCKQTVTWKAFTLTGAVVQQCLLDSDTDANSACTGRHLETGHYYLTADQTNFAQYYVGVFLSSATQVTKDVVIDLAGFDITATGRPFYIRPNDAKGNSNVLTLLDSLGSGVVTGSGVNVQGCGVLYNDGGILNIYGGKYVYAPKSTKVVFNGGVVYNSNTTNMYGGILDASAYTVPQTPPDTTNTISYKGGALYTSPGKTFTMSAGRLIGGTAWAGGTAYFSYNASVTVTGGQFYGGIAQNKDITDGGGGNVRLYGTNANTSGNARFANCAFTDGSITVAKGGGNMSVSYYTCTMDNCYMAGGTSSSYGGNIVCGSGANITAADSVIAGGNATSRGGNIHVSSTGSYLTLDHSLLTCGTTSTYGGNLTAGNGYITIKGGEISFGTAGTYGGNIVASAGNNTATTSQNTRIQADDEGNVPLIVGGTAGTYGGNLYVGGVIYLEDAVFANGTAKTKGQDVYLEKATNQGKLEIGDGVTGKLLFSAHDDLLTDGVLGGAIARTVCSALNAVITMEGDYNGAQLCVKDGTLYVGSVTVVNRQGDAVWYPDNAAAIAACDKQSYVKLYTNSNVVLTKDCAVDLNGKTVNVSGAYIFSGIDSVGGGKAVRAAETTVATDYTAPGGNRYLSVDDNGSVSFHRLAMQITNVSLRPSVEGIYYTAKWECDNTVKDMIESYGVAVSLSEVPGTDCLEEGSKSLWTTFTVDTLQSGISKTSAMVGGIMKEKNGAAINKAHGEMTIYAKAYVKLINGTVLVSSDDVAYSLYDVMKTLDRLIANDPHNYRKYSNTARAFYEKWQDNGMGEWEFDKIEPPVDDGIIDVLMIGNSFCYYYVEELYALAEAAGIPMRVCNVYYSGAKMSQHWEWWKNGESKYQFYTTDENGYRPTNGVSLEWCLAQGDWDVISLQEASSIVRTAEPNATFDANHTYYSDLLNYMKEQFPDAQLCWQQTWGYQVGYTTTGFSVPDRAAQQDYYQRVKELSLMVCQEFDVVRIPTGEAWEIIRENGYDDLCARLGKGTDHEGDYYHDGDIGGGQYLNACVWFEMITGQSVVGNSYVPTYTYDKTQYTLNDQISAQQLQNAAHQAVEAMQAEETQN